MWFLAVGLKFTCQPQCYARPALQTKICKHHEKCWMFSYPILLGLHSSVSSANTSWMPLPLIYMVNSSSSDKTRMLSLDDRDDLDSPFLHSQGAVHIGLRALITLNCTHRSAPIFHWGLETPWGQKPSIAYFLPGFLVVSRSSLGARGTNEQLYHIQRKKWLFAL